MGTLVEDLRARSESFLETHISWVFLMQDGVFKVKRPVAFSFLDFSTLEARERACRDEVALNTRLAPGVYRGVVPIRRTEDGVHVLGGEDGAIVDHAVHMARMPEARRADVLLAAGALEPRDLDRLASHLGRFHAGIRKDGAATRHGTAEAIGRAVDENFSQTRGTIERFLTTTQALELERGQRTFLAQNAGVFGDRIAAGRVGEGHGDLRLEHVYVGEDGRFVVLDCVEFSERLRCADVASDVAFLAMDLAWHGRVDLAERFLAHYARDADDFDLFALVDFYASYRAHVRAKIAATMACDTSLEVSDEVRARAATDARRYFLLALSADRRGMLAPAVVVVGGVIASGKSHLAEAIGAELGAPVIDADRTRKAMFDVAPTTPLEDAAWSGHYTKDATARVYEELFRRAALVLASGRPVVLDASFRAKGLRGAARALARAHGVPFHFVETCAPADVCRQRLRARAASAAHVSDGRLEVFDAFLASYEPVVELGASEHVLVDTTQAFEASLATVRERIPTWPRGLTA